MEHVNEYQIMRKQKPPHKLEFTMYELLELWNNCPDEAICIKIADYVKKQQKYYYNNIENKIIK